jgi:hypothetical protein
VAPRTANTIALNRLPKSPMPTASCDARSAGLAPSQVAPTMSASSAVSPTDRTNASASLKNVPRSDASFVHSERSVTENGVMRSPPGGSRRCRG